jgi:hypothetical protein
MMNILSRQTPLMVDVRQTGESLRQRSGTLPSLAQRRPVPDPGQGTECGLAGLGKVQVPLGPADGWNVISTCPVRSVLVYHLSHRTESGRGTGFRAVAPVRRRV